ncbi:ATP-dependent Clp protease proteolytic subunit [Mycobacteroides abscessus]|nr:ATP-dependent Clp protease proteolytic subunit [Mycobacteroides abscessus]MDM2426900.1 ATP-dependent Clp protease proteolytic subunit [Mycobacteroides abscessus]MDM2431770.1 ATP-dependent Clp protease proteolytic subunit [Mycobacteroides abscessus]MDM2436617.1 ATP-dependent Clp protease proteolytic subunit [Mycobacteroides abscessus]MDM2438917.1 ATP-dependent Clp protease proteolytic subunit [Mycobacteroides abscessus]
MTGDRVAKLIETVTFWDSEYPESSWEIIICSEGGELNPGTALYSTLRRFSIRGGGSHHITTRVAGQAASIAALILQAGDHRVMGPLDFLMIHEPMCSHIDETSDSIRHQVEHIDMWEQNFLKLLAERSTESDVTKIWNTYRGRDWWIRAEVARDWGFVDEIR